MHYQIVCYVPNEHVELVKSAMFAAGAGRFRGYRHCCWQTGGYGQFLPEDGSLPHIGSVGETAVVEEVKLEVQIQVADVNLTFFYCCAAPFLVEADFFSMIFLIKIKRIVAID